MCSPTLVPLDDLPRAQTVLKRFSESFCRPVLVECDNGETYVIKGTQSGRSAFNDNVVGRIANRLGMPVPNVALVHLPIELIDIDPENLGHFLPGIAHASSFIENCTEGWFIHLDLPENRMRFALLSFLYGWMAAAEKQFFYKIDNPKIVYSFDHDAFFPNGPAWNAETLAKSLETYPECDDTIYTQATVTNEEYLQTLERLRHLERPMIQEAIEAVPLALGQVDLEERVLLCEFLWNRASQMLGLETDKPE